MNEKPKEGDLRIWEMHTIPGTPRYTSVKSVKEGKALIDKKAQADLKKPWITDNAFGLEVFEGGEWCDWYCDDCGGDYDDCDCKENK